MRYEIKEVHEGKSRYVEAILRSLPQWFGHEESTLEYIHGVDGHPFFGAFIEGECVGFFSVRLHHRRTAELYVCGIRPEHHRQGLGRNLLAAVEDYATGLGCSYLMVETLSPKHPDVFYAKTRNFYENVGFKPFLNHGHWGADTPCLMMIKDVQPKVKVRLATSGDLPNLENMFKGIIENMYRHCITVWNEFYPIEEFPSDIEGKSLYLLEQNHEIVASFGIFPTTDGSEHFSWQEKNANALYLGRIGVSVNHLGSGLGGVIIAHAAQMARENGINYLRLLVDEGNAPAINLYQKHGFKQMDGVYEFTAHEKIVTLGFEREV